MSAEGPEADLAAGKPACPLWANSGLMQCGKSLSFDHLIGKCE